MDLKPYLTRELVLEHLKKLNDLFFIFVRKKDRWIHQSSWYKKNVPGIMTQNTIFNMTRSNDLASKRYWLKIRRWKFHNWVLQKRIFLASEFITNFRRFPLCDYYHCQRHNGPMALSLFTRFIALTQSEQKFQNASKSWPNLSLVLFSRGQEKHVWQIHVKALTNPANSFDKSI